MINRNNRAYSDQADSISVTRDSYGNEIPSDKPMHDNTTPAKGKFNFGGGQYSEDWNGGFSSYGVSVADKGQRNEVSVDVSRADRGKES